MDVTAMLRHMVEVGASDLHLKAGNVPFVRIDGDLDPTAFPAMSAADTEAAAIALMPEHKRREFEQTSEADFGHTMAGVGRFPSTCSGSDRWWGWRSAACVRRCRPSAATTARGADLVRRGVRGIVSQRLVTKSDGKGRIPAVEVMVATGRVYDRIIDPEATIEIRDIIAEGGFYGMQTFDQALVSLVEQGLVTEEDARAASTNPHDFVLALRGSMLRGAEAMQA